MTGTSIVDSRSIRSRLPRPSRQPLVVALARSGPECGLGRATGSCCRARGRADQPVPPRADRVRGRSLLPRRRRTSAPADALALRRRRGVDAAVDLDRNGRSRAPRIRSARSLKVLGHERLAAEPRRDASSPTARSIARPGKARPPRSAVGPSTTTPACIPSSRIRPSSWRRVAELHVHAAQVGARLRELLEPEAQGRSPSGGSPGTGRCAGGSEPRTGGPIDRLGTKCPSIRSTWSQSHSGRTRSTSSASTA